MTADPEEEEEEEEEWTERGRTCMHYSPIQNDNDKRRR